ncbi:alpha/beta hydrolase [Zobellia alginiliquefaciens]|uniref:alpha/beta hydrolase n=1 Tax=Zobellia alginiliquefaciens TaxID=3032586 RepID=UPI0023E39FB6|nr:alpha/beta hydrolase [Zobellia alginiliquefaciens]
MKKRLYFFQVLIVLVFGFQSTQAQEVYLDSIHAKIGKETFTYSDTLKLDFYSSEKGVVPNRPLLILVHGGGFSGGKRDNFLESGFSEAMAKRGYAVASISYSLRKGKSFGCDCPSTEKIETFKSVSADVLKATRFLIGKSAKLNFDKNKIILVGSSAGAEAVLNTAFLQYHPDFKKLPYGDIKFAGVVSFAGAVLNADYIVKNNAVPTLLFHGKKDKLVPFGTAPHHHCIASAAGYLMLDGSRTIAERLKVLNTSCTLVYDPNGSHDWANLPYAQVDLISEFILQNVLNGKLIQSHVRMSPKN